MTIAIEGNSLTVSNLIYKIRDICSLFEQDFDVFYLKTSQNGRIIKYHLTTDEDFAKLCKKKNKKSSLTVYVCGNSEASSSHVDAGEASVHAYVPTFDDQSPYVPSYDHYRMSSYGSYTENTNWEAVVDALGRTTASSNWFRDSYLGGNITRDSFKHGSNERGNAIPDLNKDTGSHPEHGEQPTYEDDKDADDKDYKEEEVES